MGGNDAVEAVVAAREAEFEETGLQSVLDVFEDRLGERTSVRTRRVHRGRNPADELPNLADEIDADQLVVGLRRHSRTERIVFESVANELLERVSRPVVLVPLPEGATPAI